MTMTTSSLIPPLPGTLFAYSNCLAPGVDSLKQVKVMPLAWGHWQVWINSAINIAKLLKPCPTRHLPDSSWSLAPRTPHCEKRRTPTRNSRASACASNIWLSTEFCPGLRRIKILWPPQYMHGNNKPLRKCRMRSRRYPLINSP